VESVRRLAQSGRLRPMRFSARATMRVDRPTSRRSSRS
jgi:hypothetical protein